MDRVAGREGAGEVAGGPIIGIVIQARLSSQRLPGKVLLPLEGRPLIAHLVDALRRTSVGANMILATSVDKNEDPLAEWADSEKLECYRGSLDHVAERVYGAALHLSVDALVRISGDSPLMDPTLVDEAISIFRSGELDLVTNVWRRTFPKGQSVEVLSVSALSDALPAMDEHDREHVTPLFYREAEAYRIASFEAQRPMPDVQLSVDEAQDLEHCGEVLRRIGEPAWVAGWEKCAHTMRSVVQSGEG